MKNKSNAWYYMLIVIFTILFFVCMAFCFGRFRQLSRSYMTRSLSYRLETETMRRNLTGTGRLQTPISPIGGEGFLMTGRPILMRSERIWKRRRGERGRERQKNILRSWKRQ